MSITRLSLRNPSVVGFFLAVAILGGIYAFVHLGKREDSTFKIKSAVVTCQYPGATPEEVEQLVVIPLEREFRTLGSVYKISSEAHFGYARIVVELHPSTHKDAIPQLWDELRRKVNDARPQLPEGVTTIDVADDFGDVYGLYYALTSSGGFSMEEMRQYARRIETRLYAVEGVEKVLLAGVEPMEISITLSPATLSAFDLRPEAIARAIATQNEVVGLGERQAGELTVILSEGTTYTSIADIENQLLTAADGKQYRLGDVATVERNYREPPSYIVHVDGCEAIAIAVATDPDLDIVAVGDRVDGVLRSVREELPAGLELATLYPENEIARKANYDFLVNLAESVAIVILLVMLVMGWRSGVIVGSSLLFAIGATLVVMLLMGEGINRTSLAGFIIAMGMLVDNAIVVVDNTRTLSKHGVPLYNAAITGASRPALGLFGATLIAIFSFLPLELAPSSVAEIIRPLFVVISISLLASWVLALTQVPVMSVNLLSGTQGRDGKERLGWFRSCVELALYHRWVTIASVVVLFVLSLWAMGRMPQNFFPQLSKPYFRADVILPDGYDIAATTSRLDSMACWLGEQPEVKRVSTTAGGTPPRYYLASSSYAGRANYGNVLVELHDADATAEVEERFDKWVVENMEDVWLRSSLFRLSPVPDAAIEIGFVGENIDTLSALTLRTMALMEANVGARNVRNSWGNRVAVWQPRYSQIKAQRLGVERSSMLSSLEISTSGLPVATYREGDLAMPILLRSEPLADNALSALATMPVFSRSGRSYSIEQATAGFDFGFRPSVIRRINSERVMKAQCDPQRGVNTIALLTELKQQVASDVTLPEGYRMELFGEEESREESNAALVGKLPIALILIFITLLLLFGNLRDPMVVLVTLPLIFIGVVLGLGVTGKMFDFFSLLGLLGLIGMNVKNAVILVSRIRELREDGYEAHRAVVVAATDRFIPVVAASLTTILGMLPLLADSMFGSMAATIMGGLLVATMLVLIVLPVVYSLFYRIKP
ncbi:MAG: efflux RND transporter permease subunit [Alistipes sp.]|nr:efflux RND transporter permease subunit [Alistipes sp.]